jgi:hypothetical protein
MKPQILRLILLAMVMVVMAPRSADANLLSWLSRLSGPGPFWGVDVSVCVDAVPVGDADGTTPPPATMEPQEVTGFLFPCTEMTFERRHVSFNINGGAAYAWKNPLNYDNVDVGRSDNVWLLKLGTSADYTAAPSFDIGAGVGIFHFGGKRFANFTRPYVEPVRVAVRPLLWRSGRDAKQRNRDAWLVLTASWIIHLGTMDGADFGAPNDPFRSHNEHNWQAGVSLDVLRLLKK